MPDQQTIYTRRDFIRTGMLGSALTWTVPTFLGATMQSLHAAADGSLVQGPDGRNDPILVVVQLSGGNDGLNTLIPHGNDHYHRARPRLGIKADAVAALNDEVGLHPALTQCKALYDEGQLGLIQGVGYPNPNRSHFRSMEIWHTGSDANKTARTGWLGRYFDNQCNGCDPDIGVSIGKKPPQAFNGGKSLGVTFQDPKRYRYAGLEDAGDADDIFYTEMNQEHEDVSGSSIEELGAGKTQKPGESSLDFLERTAMNAQVSSDRIQGITQGMGSTPYQGNGLQRDLSTVANLIQGGMKTRVYYVSQGGFDTHANQSGTHARLMANIDNALGGFMQTMKKAGLGKQVCVMVFSEFGRRVKENASGGTDHGAAGPMMILGGGVQPGIHGSMPSLAPEDLHRGDLVHNLDFRSVYTTVLNKHLHTNPKEILGRSFPEVKLFA